VQENKIAMKTDSANVLVWDFTDNQTIGPWKCGGTIRSIAFNADGTRIAIAGFGMLAGVWDIISKTRIGNFNSQLSEAISLSASPNGKRFIIGHAGEGICLCDAETLREVCTLETRQVTSSVDMTADGQFITALNGVTAQIYAAPNFTEFQPGTPAFLNRIEFENARRLRDLGGREYLGYKSHDAEKTLVDALTRFKKLDEVADQASTLLLLGDVYRSLGQLDEAEKNHREALELRRTFLEAQDPGVIDSCQELAITLAMRQKLTEAELLCTNSLHVQNELAWFLATGSESKYRDGARAVKLAGEVVALTGRKLDIYLGTLAVAYAEVGDFTNAVAVQREAIARLENQKLKNDFETRLKMFEDHVPFHQMQHQIE
jgi:hypothetical protein